YLSIVRTPLFKKELRFLTFRKKLNSFFYPFAKAAYYMKKLSNTFITDIREEGIVRGPLKTLSKAIRKVTPYTAHAPHYMYRLARAIYSFPADKEYVERQGRERAWYQANGDATLRVDYDLNENSLVIDVGGYKGDWVSVISNMHGCTIHVFEPVKEFAFEIQKRFKNNKNIIIHETGLGIKNENMTINLAEGGTSTIKESEAQLTIAMVNAHEFMQTLNKPVDLIKINIEGGEYDLLEQLIATGDILKIKNIQVQFHNFVPNAVERMEAIQKALEKTHHRTYHYEFVWENWERNEQ
ncbi:MAG: methyltransferase FkbM family, partial [Candidatus Nomurabacteria bacterium]|nr:methyltransferase FkbM family [Candidatus Nomurabacteria bacterium]